MKLAAEANFLKAGCDCVENSGMQMASRMRVSTFRAVVLLVVIAILPLAASLGPEVLKPSASAGFNCPPYNPVPPVGGGTSRGVSNQVELAAALKAAQPGDTINLATGTYEEIQFRAEYGHRSGTADAPITIQAAPGATPVIDPGGGSVSDRYAVAAINVKHVEIRGLDIRHGVFGALSSGSRGVVFAHNDIHDVGLAGVVVNSSTVNGTLSPSSQVTIRCNRIHHTGRSEPEYGEGIYLGSGKTGAVDATTGVVVEGNDIFSIANEAIDVKRHVTDVIIRYNHIHDVSPYYGGAISMGLNKNSWGPANYLVEHNRIWNVRSGLYYAQAIAVAHGPTTIRHNVIWNVESNPSDSWPWTAPIQVHGDDNTADWAYGFGNPAANEVTIENNTIIGCRESCIDSYTEPGEITPRLIVVDNIVDQVSGNDAANNSDVLVSAADLVGPTGGTADAGTGPGSGLVRRQTPVASQPSTSVPGPTSTIPTVETSTVPKPVPSTTTLQPSSSPSTETVPTVDLDQGTSPSSTSTINATTLTSTAAPTSSQSTPVSGIEPTREPERPPKGAEEPPIPTTQPRPSVSAQDRADRLGPAPRQANQSDRQQKPTTGGELQPHPTEPITKPGGQQQPTNRPKSQLLALFGSALADHEQPAELPLGQRLAVGLRAAEKIGSGRTNTVQRPRPASTSSHTGDGAIATGRPVSTTTTTAASSTTPAQTSVEGRRR